MAAQRRQGAVAPPGGGGIGGWEGGKARRWCPPTVLVGVVAPLPKRAGSECRSKCKSNFYLALQE